MLFWKKKKNLESSTENNSNNEIERKEDKVDSSTKNSEYSSNLKEANIQKKVATKKTSSSKKSATSKKKSVAKKASNSKKTSSSKKKPVKKSTTSKKTKENRNIYHVTPRKDKSGKKIGWEVKLEGSKKVTAFCKTKDEAISKVRTFASNKGATIMIKRSNGSHHETIKL